ncbi:Uncharacterised protein [Mycobacterium tuberculosis]|uniref:Uncharacterized protein n=1 Tax=Mycobacterium tuberculosis TaxID=1773 RepID=A0A0U0QQ49_MYCTX|nr:Uncharacterised protein [Mycobacterium tuberculosis]COV25900.1 Uncharacterised protein [Mycobacterium tuberculosis]
MHVRRGIDGDFVVAGDAHRHSCALVGGLDGSNLANGDTAVGHIGRRIQATRCGQVGLQGVLPDTHQTRNSQVVPAQYDDCDYGDDRKKDQLASDEASQHWRFPLSTSGPPGASLGFGVYRMSGIIVSGSRPKDCSRARNAPENPVPVRNALSMAL